MAIGYDLVRPASSSMSFRRRVSRRVNEAEGGAGSRGRGLALAALHHHGNAACARLRGRGLRNKLIIYHLVHTASLFITWFIRLLGIVAVVVKPSLYVAVLHFQPTILAVVFLKYLYKPSTETLQSSFSLQKTIVLLLCLPIVYRIP